MPHIEKRSNDRHRSERHIRHERVGKREINRVAGQRQRATERQKSRAFQSPNQTVHRKHADQRKHQRRDSQRIERKAPRNAEKGPPKHLRDQRHAGPSRGTITPSFNQALDSHAPGPIVVQREIPNGLYEDNRHAPQQSDRHPIHGRPGRENASGLTLLHSVAGNAFCSRSAS